MEMIINKCEVCDDSNLDEVLCLGNHPMCDDLKDIGSEIECKEYPITILFCDKCKTAYQKFNVDKQTLFPKNYHYRARFTKDVLNGMNDLVNSLSKKTSLKNKIFLDIGCNDGSLLNFAKENEANTYGVEPTDAYKDCSDSHVIYNNYFDKELVELFIKNHGKPDIITFTNVFAHIEDLKSLINNLNLLKKKETIIVIENHYLGSIIKNNQFDTFYHEHPRSYSHNSFKYISKKLNSNILSVEFPQRYGGNIRVFISEIFNKNEYFSDEENFKKSLIEMNNFIILWKKNMREQIDILFDKYGKLHSKAFPGRAAILIKMLNLDSNIINCIYEKPNSPKIGKYVPGTKIPIISDKEMNLDAPVILNFAWHIKNEIRQYLKKIGYKNTVVDIM